MTKIDHPDYYQRHEFECIDFIEDHGLGFCIGNVVKYLTRAGRKSNSSAGDDLKKALWYLKRVYAKFGMSINSYPHDRTLKISTDAYVLDHKLDFDVADIIRAICDKYDISLAIVLLNNIIEENGFNKEEK